MNLTRPRIYQNIQIQLLYKVKDTCIFKKKRLKKISMITDNLNRELSCTFLWYEIGSKLS